MIKIIIGSINYGIHREFCNVTLPNFHNNACCFRFICFMPVFMPINSVISPFTLPFKLDEIGSESELLILALMCLPLYVWPLMMMNLYTSSNLTWCLVWALFLIFWHYDLTMVVFENGILQLVKWVVTQ